MRAVSGCVGVLAGVVFLILIAVIPAGANLFVTSSATDQVLEYDGTTGAFITDFVPAGSGGLSVSTGLVFGPNGNLFVSSLGTDQVLEYNGTTGAFVTAFVPVGSGGLAFPSFLTFGPQISVPEPATLFLIGLGLLGASLARRHRRFKSSGPCALADDTDC